MDWIKTSIEGSAIGVLLSVLSIVLLNISALTLLGAYALLLLLLSMYLTSSPRAGALLGLFAVIGESVTDLAYFVLAQGLPASLVPYAAGLILFVGRIPVFPLLGAIGGHLGREYFADSARPRSQVRNRRYMSRRVEKQREKERKKDVEKKEERD